jgi:site-specific DNA recombinase
MSPKKKPKLPIDIYVRVSRTNGRDVEAEGMTASEQEARCRAQLEAHGLTAGQVFTDLDQSGGKASRPAFDLMKERIAEGKSGGVIVWKLSRFGRRTRQVLKDVAWVEECGAAFVCVNPPIDTSTPTGRFILTIFAALDELELDELTEEWARRNATNIGNGVHLGPTPAGYTREVIGEKRPGEPRYGKLTPDPEMAALVVRAFELRAQGESYGEIAKFLRESGLRNAKGESDTWSRPGVTKLLENPTYLGQVRSGNLVTEGAHEAIVSRALWLAVRKKDNDPSTYKRSSGKREPALLAGMCRCVSCDGLLTPDLFVRANGDHYRVYRCRLDRCPAKVSISGELLEEYILDRLANGVTLARPMSGLGDEKQKELEVELREVEAEIEEVFATGVSPTSAARLVAGLEERKAEIEDQLATLVTAPGVVDGSLVELPGDFDHSLFLVEDGKIWFHGEALRNLLEREWDMKQRRRWLQRVIKKIEISPSKKRGDVRERVKLVLTDEAEALSVKRM